MNKKFKAGKMTENSQTLIQKMTGKIQKSCHLYYLSLLLCHPKLYNLDTFSLCAIFCNSRPSFGLGHLFCIFCLPRFVCVCECVFSPQFPSLSYSTFISPLLNVFFFHSRTSFIKFLFMFSLIFLYVPFAVFITLSLNLPGIHSFCLFLFPYVLHHPAFPCLLHLRLAKSRTR